MSSQEYYWVFGICMTSVLVVLGIIGWIQAEREQRRVDERHNRIIQNLADYHKTDPKYFKIEGRQVFRNLFPGFFESMGDRPFWVCDGTLEDWDENLEETVARNRAWEKTCQDAEEASRKIPAKVEFDDSIDEETERRIREAIQFDQQRVIRHFQEIDKQIKGGSPNDGDEQRRHC